MLYLLIFFSAYFFPWKTHGERGKVFWLFSRLISHVYKITLGSCQIESIFPVYLKVAIHLICLLWNRKRKKSAAWKILVHAYLRTSCKSFWKVTICEIVPVLITLSRTSEVDKTALGQFELLLFTFKFILYCLDRTGKMSCPNFSTKVCFPSIKSVPFPLLKMWYLF
jgi:hypothetical protein